MFTKLAKPNKFNEGAPKINAAPIFGASPCKEILYKIPVTGERPMIFTADLPQGLTISENGIIAGKTDAGRYEVAVCAENRLGKCQKHILFVIEDGAVCQTPLMGWTSWNAFRDKINHDVILSAAKALVDTGLSEYGYRFVNIDSDWQGVYGGKYNAIMPNEKFPDMQKLCRDIHALGLKCGIYSTPMLKAWGCGTSLPGCTRGDMDMEYRTSYFGIGTEHFEQNNVDQWTEWGFDYLKYDWRPCDIKNADLMKQCLKKSSRDFAFCVTVDAEYDNRDYWKENCTSWRENHDSDDVWEILCEVCFGADRWLEHASLGHYFDLDMLETGVCNSNKCRLTEDEQLVGYTARVIFPSPIQISCDLNKLSEFDIAMLCNEEVIAVNQDALGLGAIPTFEKKTVDEHRNLQTYVKIYEKKLADGKKAVAIFNLGNTAEEITIEAEERVRDLWAKETLSSDDGKITISMHPHTVRLLKL